jgi:translation initiation factor 2 beta subunit (eIF-2beta)/eIF-5
MKSELLQPESNLQTLESELALTKQEMEEFKKLPKEEQKRQKDEKLEKLKNLSSKLDVEIQEAIRTGKLDEARNLKEIIEKEMRDLEDQIKVTERPEIPNMEVMEVIPDPEITSAQTAVARLEENGHRVFNDARYLLRRVEWREKLRSTYEIVSCSVGDLFGDRGEHTYAEIKVKAQELELGLIPPALVPSIQLSHKKNNFCATVAMEF